MKRLIKEPTCYKNPNKSSCIDLILTKKPRSFQHSFVIETGLSDFYKMTVTVMKTFFEKLQPRVLKYRDYKYFANDKFRTDLLSGLGKANIEEKQNGLNNLLNECKRILDIHASRKHKYARSNRMPFINKALSKEILTRTRLGNKLLSEENKKKYSKQRNYCVSLLRKSKSDYFGNLNEKNINDNKTFSKTIKPFLSDRVRSTNKMTLIDKEQIIAGDCNTASFEHFLF